MAQFKQSDEVDLEIARRMRPPRDVPLQGVDRSGMPPVQELARHETNALRRLSPRRNRWPELVELDQRVGELEQRHAAATERRREVTAQLANAPLLDADRRGAWELAGRKGAEPLSTIPALEKSAAALEAEAAGLLAAVDRVLEQRQAFIEKHRERLAADAEQAANAKHAELSARIDEAERAREELTELRESVLWARCYGTELAGRHPTWRLFAGGLARPVRDTLGIDVQLEYRRLLDAVRADANWLLSAATAEQRAALEGRDPRTPPGTVWEDTDEGKLQRREESQAYRRRHRERFGTEAPF